MVFSGGFSQAPMTVWAVVLDGTQPHHGVIHQKLSGPKLCNTGCVCPVFAHFPAGSHDLIVLLFLTLLPCAWPRCPKEPQAAGKAERQSSSFCSEAAQSLAQLFLVPDSEQNHP